MKLIKKFMLLFFILLGSLISFNSFATNSKAPSFETNFAKTLTSSKSSEHLYNIGGVSSDKTIKDNIEALFFPPIGTGNGGALWNVLRYVGMVLVFVYILYSAVQLITSMGKPDKLKGAVTNLLYVLVGSFLFFGAMWIFSSVFNINSLQSTSGVSENLTSATGLPFFILSFLKGAAFFIAIVYIVSIGFQLMNPSTGESGDGKKLIKKLGNVIFALVAIKVVDFLYYIASQQNFASEAGNFIIQVAKFLAYLSGIVMVIMIIYSGYLLVVDGGKGENFKKAKNTLINILLAIVALFFFLFILFQIFSEFGGNS